MLGLPSLQWNLRQSAKSLSQAGSTSVIALAPKQGHLVRLLLLQLLVHASVHLLWITAVVPSLTTAAL